MVNPGGKIEAAPRFVGVVFLQGFFGRARSLAKKEGQRHPAPRLLEGRGWVFGENGEVSGEKGWSSVEKGEPKKGLILWEKRVWDG